MFDKQKAESRFQFHLKWYGIKIRKYRTTSCGRAYWNCKEIEVPHIINADTFGVCMHEIKHIIDGNKGKRYEQEFDCDMFARKEIIELGFDVSEWDKRMRWHSLSRIAMAVNRGLDIDKIPQRIKSYFSDIDFERWREQASVFVSADRKFNNLNIILRNKELAA